MSPDYFLNPDVLFLAKDLIGKYVFTQIGGQIAGGMIIETEAYRGTEDRASHAFGGRRTKRNEMMYAQGGVAYVYFCYGMHYMLNFVTNQCDIPDAVLIRAILPTHGEELMLKRTGKKQCVPEITSGPGKLCKALGISMSENGASLFGNTVWVEDRGVRFQPQRIESAPRIGIAYAQEDALLPYRFVLR